jgi:hypothetical protein
MLGLNLGEGRDGRLAQDMLFFSAVTEISLEKSVIE